MSIRTARTCIGYGPASGCGVVINECMLKPYVELSSAASSESVCVCGIAINQALRLSRMPKTVKTTRISGLSKNEKAKEAGNIKIPKTFQ